jgi:hypothetical protein
MDLAAPGGIKAPAATSTADITAVFGMISLLRLEHVGAAIITGGTREQAEHRKKRGKDVITFGGYRPSTGRRISMAAYPHLLFRAAGS